MLGPAIARAQEEGHPLTAIEIPRVDRPPTLEDFLPAMKAEQESPRKLPTRLVAEGIGVDGAPREDSLTDAPTNGARAAMARVEAFYQREPGDGNPVSQPTSAYLSYDQDNLYVAFVARDEPGKVRANLARREAIDDDDQVLVYLDTFDDNQRAYLFAVNPYGVQLDGIRTEGGDEDITFDQVWTSEGRVMNEGYVVMMAIPFRSLRFPRKLEQTWGIALGRVIQRNNEESYWPHITEEVNSFVPQFGTLQGLEEVSPGRNIQFNPYYAQARSREFDDDVPRHHTVNDTRVGLDAKVVVQDALTLDVTLNPDFSQVESDDPQVTANERFEVFFPEKRPFFLENAGFFQTPENLFFSRRIVDPGLGARLTGKMGRWAFGAVAINDRANEQVDTDELLSGDNALIGVLRVQREVGKGSSVGILITDRELSDSRSHDRAFSADARLRLGDNWELVSQLIHSAQRVSARGPRAPGWGGVARVAFEARNLDIGGEYRAFTPNFDLPIGFVNRVGFRAAQAEADYGFKPENFFVTEIGPAFSLEYLWDHETGILLDREIDLGFSMELLRDSELEFTRQEIFERFAGLAFRPHENEVTVGTAWLKWLFFDASYRWGTAVNHDPADDLDPSLMKLIERQAELTLLPTPRLRMGLEYGDLSLHTRGTASTEVFFERQLRTKINYQYNRQASLRAIFDYALVNADASLVDEDPREREWGVDLLFTYLLFPGSAVHVGYVDQFENLAVVRDEDDELGVINTRYPTFSVGRQLFVKISYLWRL